MGSSLFPLKTMRTESVVPHLWTQLHIKKELALARFKLLETVPLSYFGIRLPQRLFSVPLLGEVAIACADICAIKR